MERKCVKCAHTKPMDQFKKLHGDGYSSYCERCRGSARRSMTKIKTKEERTAAHKKWRELDPKAARYRYQHSNLMRAHGISLEEFNAMHKAQNDRCLICGNEHDDDSRFSRLHVDHDHTTGKIRGLLCSRCNTALGLFKEDIEVMAKAIEYLRRGGQLNDKYEVVK